MGKGKIHFLFVCTGNVCRSPMAEGIFKSLTKNKPNLTCESAGTFAYNGFPASPNAQQASKKYGVDISYHLSQLITNELLEKSDVILVMTNNHINALKQSFSEYCGKVFLLKEYGLSDKNPSELNIVDPIGRDFDTYEKCYLEIEEAIKGVLKKT